MNFGPDINQIQNVNAVNATSKGQDTFSDGSMQKNIAVELLKESENWTNDSNSKKELAMQYLQASDHLMKLSQAIRQKADDLRKGEVDKDIAVRDLNNAAGDLLQFPIPKNATPELLEQIADSLEKKAKQNRVKADDLLKDSERSSRLARDLKEQSDILNEKGMNFSDLRLKSIAAHNEGLNMVFKKLGIFRLDAEYKEQVAYSQKKSSEGSKRMG